MNKRVTSAMRAKPAVQETALRSIVRLPSARRSRKRLRHLPERGWHKDVVDLVRFRHSRNDKGLAVRLTPCCGW